MSSSSCSNFLVLFSQMYKCWAEMSINCKDLRYLSFIRINSSSRLLSSYTEVKYLFSRLFKCKSNFFICYFSSAKVLEIFIWVCSQWLCHILSNNSACPFELAETCLTTSRKHKYNIYSKFAFSELSLSNRLLPRWFTKWLSQIDPMSWPMPQMKSLFVLN